METQVRIYSSKSRNKFYCKESHICSSCNQDIKNAGILLWGNSGLNVDKQFFCMECFSDHKIKTVHKISGRMPVIFSKTMPVDSVPILSWITGLKDCNTSLSDIGNIKSDYTNDKTRYANRDSFKNLQIGDTSIIHDGRDLPMRPQQFLYELEQIKKAKPITDNLIGHEEKKRIGVDMNG